VRAVPAPAKEHQHDHDGRSLEVNCDFALVLHGLWKQSGRTIATALNTNAAPTPMAISVNMFR